MDNERQEKRRRAQNDLEELLQMMEQMNIEKPTAPEQNGIRKVELPPQETGSEKVSDIQEVQEEMIPEEIPQEELPAEEETSEETEASEQQPEQPEIEEYEEEISGEQLAAEIMAEITAEKAAKAEENEECEKSAESEEQTNETVLQETEAELPEEEEDAEQQQVEEILNRQAKKHHPEQPMATVYLGEKGKQRAEADKKKQTQKKKRLTKKEREARRRKKRIQRICVIGAMLLIVILILVSCVRAVKGIAGGANGSGSGSGYIAGVTEEQDTRPASQQESDAYLAIKDSTDLPDYALEYPGMYSDAVSIANKETEEGKKVCYLTFDDGPSSSNTPQLLDILKEEGVKATFFVVANEIDGSEDVLKRIVDEGHTLCIHANEHDYEKIYQSAEAYLEDFAAAYDKIYEITGYRVQGFRFPGGSNNGVMKNCGTYDAIVEEMTRRGFEYYDWNAYNHDSEGGNYTVEQMVEFAVSEVNGSSRSDVILLMHDAYGKDKTVAALKDIINQLRTAGIEMLPIDNTTRPVHFSVNDNTPEELPQEEASESETEDGEQKSADTEEE